MFTTKICNRIALWFAHNEFWRNHEYTVRKLVLHFKTKQRVWVLSCSPGLEFWNPFFHNELLNSFVRKHFRQLNIDENHSHGSSWRRTSVIWKWWEIALVFGKHGGKKTGSKLSTWQNRWILSGLLLFSVVVPIIFVNCYFICFYLWMSAMFLHRTGMLHQLCDFYFSVVTCLRAAIINTLVTCLSWCF